MKFNKIFSVLMGAALLGGAWSCTDKVEPTPSPAAGNQEVYFPEDESLEVAIPLDATEVSVQVNRVVADEELTVALTSEIVYLNGEGDDAQLTEATGIFTVPSSVTFAAGEKTAKIVIGVDFPKLEMGVDYLCTITIDGAQQTPYGLSSRTFTLIYVPWTDWKLYSESDPGIYQMSTLWDYEYGTPVYVRNSLLNENLVQYMVLSPFSDYEYEQIIEMDKSWTIDVDGTECTVVYMANCLDTPIQNSSGGYYSYTTAYTFLTQVYIDSETGKHFTKEEAVNVMANMGWNTSYYNPEQGRFYLYMIPYVNGGGFYNNICLETLQLPGDFHDYYFTFNFEGSMISPETVEYALVEVVPSADVAFFSCAMLDGKPTAEELEAAYTELENDEEAELIYDGTYTLSYPIDGSGDYTVIAIGYGEDKKVAVRASQTFNIEAMLSYYDYNKLGYVDYYDGIMYSFLSAVDESEMMSVEIEERKDMPGMYRLINPYKTWSFLDYFSDMSYADGKHYMYIDATTPNGGVLMQPWRMGIDLEGIGQPEVVSMGYYRMINDGWTLSQVISKKLGGKVEDDCITFPAGGLLISFPDATEEDWQGMYYTNRDPKAPSGFPTFGKGAFEIDMSMLASAPRRIGRQNSLPTTKQLWERLNADKASLDRFKSQTRSFAKKANKPTQQEIRDYKFAASKMKFNLR